VGPEGLIVHLIDVHVDSAEARWVLGEIELDIAPFSAKLIPQARRAALALGAPLMAARRGLPLRLEPLLRMALGQYGRDMAAKPYDEIDPSVLKALPNPGGAIELKHKAPEVTFLGARNQPDFGTLYVTFYPSETVIELKSLKDYLYQWRDTSVSYERFLDVVYDHLMQVYEPVRLRLVFETRPRGGISSKLTVDSDWAIRGGKEQFQDWVRLDDTW
jgi:7-cyano-7-deazaguanine reductase